MKTADFYYDLPEELIAKFPSSERRGSRLLYLDPVTTDIRHQQFNEFENFINPEDLLVFNNTKVIPARLFARKETGGKVEILIERILHKPIGTQIGTQIETQIQKQSEKISSKNSSHVTQVLAQVRASHAPKIGSILSLLADSEINLSSGSGSDAILGADSENAVVACAEVLGRSETGFYYLNLHSELPIEDLLEKIGHLPLPPYLARADRPEDKERYQTVYAKVRGAVAAPTAGLHFDENLLEILRKKGTKLGFITLHVGAGTFQPIKTEYLDQHQMHSEIMEVPENLWELIQSTRQAGGRVIAVGTTVLRCLESFAKNVTMGSYRGETNLFIKPGFEFKVVDALLTNFHLPASSLLVLVSAFAGQEAIFKAYAAAIAEKYRFFSFGDAMFISRRTA